MRSRSLLFTVSTDGTGGSCHSALERGSILDRNLLVPMEMKKKNRQGELASLGAWRPHGLVGCPMRPKKKKADL